MRPLRIYVDTSVIGGCLDEEFAAPSRALLVSETRESRSLRDAYLSAKVLGEASTDDAHHVALATVARADLVASWNFRHIVHIDKIRKFNAVNLLQGYGSIDIRSPLEVV